jgi:hypothetical protein
VAIWAELHPDQTGADAIDAELHAERVSPAWPIADQYAGVAQRRVGRDRPASQLHVHAELAEQTVGEQADQVRVARDARIDPGERRGRDGGPAEPVGALGSDQRGGRSGGR